MVGFFFRNRSSKPESKKSDDSFQEVTTDNLLRFPWNLWRDLKKSDFFFRKNLSNSLYFTLQLRFFRNYIQEEFSKNRSRKGAAVKRAYRYSKNDAKKVVDSLNDLDLNNLWSVLDDKSSFDPKSLKERLDVILAKNPSSILKNEPEVPSESIEVSEGESDKESNPESLVQEDGLSDSLEECSESEEQPPKTLKNGINKIEDRFFKLDEMETFANQEYEPGDDIDYFDSLGEESDDSVAAADMKYSDFFRDPEETDGESVEDLKPFSCDKNIEGLDEYDKEMELMLQKLENEGGDEEDDNYVDELDELLDFDQKQEELEEEDEVPEDYDQDEEDEISLKISQIEKELVAPKHWSLMGESTAKQRPRNSLLDVELELPQSSSVIHNTEPVTEDTQEEQQEQLPIEVIITQRIKAGVFDNVERKVYEEDQLEASERLKKSRQEEIDFNKSELGLGEVYAQKYKDQFMAIDKLDSHKKELAEQFSKLVYKLDSLSNSTFVPKRVSESEKINTVPTISVETPINLVISDHHKDGSLGVNSEKLAKGLKVSRSTKKRKFKNKIKGLVKSGRITIDQVKNMKEKMINRNKKLREDAKSKRETGLSTREASRNDHNSLKRINPVQLLSNINGNN